ncbi:PAS domain-containing protein [Hymenobacter sp. 15J16-1T3B]|uniref:sensor histidine kinase n=1 Tax=Hymenobacter sp. 15J16-1T3B TaxID=2886941 RepID=UPI001D117070|nr:ATP-binding protein [Hymenobacter sp. 15J16-1T3B]MCC3157153.1 PAS domain-containing protein [Hymenobacter sp. 15J16-1T3B]
MTEHAPRPAADLARENEELRHRLQEAEELITAIRTGTIDALAVQAPEGPRIFTLEGADQSYRDLIEQMNEGALLLSQNDTVLYCNACLAGLLKAPLETMMGASFRDFVPADYLGYWQDLLTTGWAGKSKGEMPLLALDGQQRPVAVALNVLLFNQTPVLAIIITDVSEQREINAIRARVSEQNALLERQQETLRTQALAQRAAEQTAAETSRILEGIPHIAWTANPAGRNTYLNHRWFEYTGHDSHSDSAHSFSALIHPDDLPAAVQRWQECIGSGEALEIECRIRSASGDYRWMLGRALPSRNEQGDIIQWIGAYTDIHEHKMAQQRVAETQQQLRASNEQLLRINRDLDNFIYTASHDLKAPINNIEGLLAALLAELPAELMAGPAVEPLVGMMQDSVDRFKRTIEHLTEVTRLQKEHEQPPVLVELAPVVQAVRLDLTPLLEAAGAELEVDVARCGPVRISEKNLRSVVYNLLSNALKYRHPDRPPRVRVRCRASDEYQVLTVEDNGLGLQVAGNAKLFAMFQRFHDHVEGSGIGLYMVKRIMENAGGRVDVESTVGAGSIFSVYFRR